MRAFIALELNDESRQFSGAQQALVQQQPWAAHVRWVRVDDMHVTMRFLGEDVSDAHIAAIREALKRAVLAEPNSFPLTLREAGFFPNPAHPRVLVCRVERSTALLDWARAIEQIAVGAGLPRERKAFDAHVTLGRCRPGFPALPTLDISEARQSWRPAALTVYGSTLGPHGPIYTPIERCVLLPDHA